MTWRNPLLFMVVFLLGGNAVGDTLTSVSPGNTSTYIGRISAIDLDDPRRVAMDQAVYADPIAPNDTIFFAAFDEQQWTYWIQFDSGESYQGGGRCTLVFSERPGNVVAQLRCVNS